MNPPAPEHYDFKSKKWWTKHFYLACLYPPCRVCNNSGNIYFAFDDKHYPNAPCPVCRYHKLQAWCEHWGIDKNIHRWLRNKYLNESNRFIRGPRGVHRRRTLFTHHLRGPLGGEPQPAGGEDTRDESSRHNPLVSGSSSSELGASAGT
jgi:hypothetical protein